MRLHAWTGLPPALGLLEVDAVGEGRATASSWVAVQEVN